MSYVSYTHVERLGHPNVDGLLLGQCYVFPKLDGTNAVIWVNREDGTLGTGSRRRDMSASGTDDNHGFRYEMRQRWDAGGLKWLDGTYGGVTCPIFYGEWLVPHSLRTYRDDAWRELYIFDARCPETRRYIPYYEWAPDLIEAGANVIDPLMIINNPTEEDIDKIRDTHNTYLIREGEGLGEGVVVKNYEFSNHVGKTVWGKSVRNDFKEKNMRAMGPAERNGTAQVEADIAEWYVTGAFVEKTRAKVGMAMLQEARDCDVRFRDEADKRQYLEACRGKMIPRLLQTVYTELIEEETVSFVKKFKDPTINFKKLRQFTTLQVKKFAKDLF